MLGMRRTTYPTMPQTSSNCAKTHPVRSIRSLGLILLAFSLMGGAGYAGATVATSTAHPVYSAHSTHRLRGVRSARSRSGVPHRVHHPVRHTAAAYRSHRVRRVASRRRAVAHRMSAARREDAPVSQALPGARSGNQAASETSTSVADTQPVAATRAEAATRNPAMTAQVLREQASLAPVRSSPISDVIPTYMPLPMRGTHELLVHQNVIADVEGLNRIQNDAQLNAMVRSGALVRLPVGSALDVDPRLPVNRRYCRPWTARFLGEISRAHEELFGHPLQVNSAVRTVNFQRRLMRFNGNAAPASGDTASPHLTGETIDITKKGMSPREIGWMRAALGELQRDGKMDVEEEFEQAVFHISVYKTYAPGLVPHTVPRTIETQQMVASSDGEGSTGDAASATARQAAEPTFEPASATSAIGGVVRPAAARTRRRHYAHSSHPVHRTVVHRRHRRRSGVSLLAAGLR